MKKILIYSDAGAERFGVRALISAFKQELVDTAYGIELVDRNVFLSTDWIRDTHLLVFPGGRDIPYHEALTGRGNQHIADYVRGGGQFLGICAGGYYGAASIEFERGGPLEVVAQRELQFYPGLARGPAYGLGKFCYRSSKGAGIAQLRMTKPINGIGSPRIFFNGGCAFIGAEDNDALSIIARYEDIAEQPAAIIQCKVGSGQAILSGVHPEYSALSPLCKKHIGSSLYQLLQESEHERRQLFQCLLKHLKLYDDSCYY